MVAIRYTSPIDPHVHFRWNEYPHFMRFAFQDAFAVGLRAAIAQGNTDPPLTEEEPITKYYNLLLKTMKEVQEEENYPDPMDVAIHGVFTPDLDQQDRLMNFIERPGSPVVSGKIFYVRSTGSGKIEIVDTQKKRESWMHGGKRDFNGNRTGHFEKGSLFRRVYDSSHPITHSVAQPPEAEPAEVEEQFKNAHDSGFRGRFIIFHTSNPETVKLVNKLVRKHNPKFSSYFEATFHHLLLNSDEDYKIHGNNVKMNPALRPRWMQEGLLEEALRGNITMSGTDHAPHDIEKKRSRNPPSGIPAIAFYPEFVRIMREYGMKEEILENMLFNNANQIYFQGRLKPRTVEVEYNPQLWEKYGFNPFSRIDGTRKAA